MRVIVTGTRDGLASEDHLRDRLLRLPDGVVIVEGGAEGVDRQARGLAERMPHKRFEVETWKAAWTLHGRVAGPIRNQQMLEAGADLVIAYPGPRSKGTWDMIRRACSANVPTEIYPVEAAR